MVTKVLAWSSFGTAILFAILGMTGIFAWDALGADTARVVLVAATAVLVLTIILAVALLVWAAFDKES